MTLILRISNKEAALALDTHQHQWMADGGTIGRASSNDWVLPDTRGEISRVHARISYENGHYYLEDLSTNGVYVGAQHERIESRYFFQSGDIIHIGHYQIAVELDDEGEMTSLDSMGAMVADTFDFAKDMSIPAPLAQDAGAFDELAPAMAPESLKKSAAPFIPEDWAAGIYTSQDKPESPLPPIPSAKTDQASNRLDKEAVFAMMSELLSHFDAEYVDACLSASGGRDTVFETMFNEFCKPSNV